MSINANVHISNTIMISLYYFISLQQDLHVR